ncbi:hypothetical protein [Bifidobacterium leontopitheci]|uniref:Uncharacterized protein n=1 Tax=Bifidobacterium leontopitheci TaxID=2650774 RepID=A0A6I1GKM0_9BIFI|nr:hypothetical protein [Bifidobacterium leontopitheci]KAB7789917.1 hypothetical protein F7D09_1584 [Bifidobacterium leontopitheci]
MSSSTTPGQPGHNPDITIIAMIVFAPYADRLWVSTLLAAVVIYGIAVDWKTRK